MRQQAISASESLPHIANSAYPLFTRGVDITPRSGGPSVATISVSWQEPLPPPNFKTFDQMFSEYLKPDAVLEAKIRAARPRLATMLTEGQHVIGLQQLRLRKGFSQVELAKAIGQSQAAVSRIENGTTNPGLETIKALRGALDVEWEELMLALSDVPHE